jgi:hypothetical protein
MVQRRTYVVTVREPDGHATVKDVRSGKTIRMPSPEQAGEQIARWLREEREREDRVSGRP